MKNIKFPSFTITISLNLRKLHRFQSVVERNSIHILIAFLYFVAGVSFLYFYQNGLGLSYNDARSHLDIGRRVVEGLKPGIAQLGSVWLPLPHLLMIPTIWNDFMWHSGLAGAIQSMIAFVTTGIVVYLFLRRFNAGIFSSILGVLLFVANLNILYLQSTAMTELLLIACMTVAVYEFMIWLETDHILNLIKSSFWIMLASLNRYDGWFLFVYLAFLLIIYVWRKKGYKAMEGSLFTFSTLAGFGILLWFLWNLLIFKDPLYFAFGPYSAHAQQQQLSQAGILATKGNILLSMQVYLYALLYNCNTFIVIIAAIGAVTFYLDKTIKPAIKLASTALFVPFVFNVIALYLGHSVLFIQGFIGGTWFNVRYGIMMMPAIAIFVGYLLSRLQQLKWVLIGLLIFVTFFSFANGDAVTIDDARVGSSQKNVSEVSGWLNKYAKDKEGFILISAASHDAIIFSSGLPMSRFIHEGTGTYWESATTAPDSWARWIIMRTNDLNDQTFKLIHAQPGFKNYQMVGHYPFADIYELKPQYLKYVHTKPTLKNYR